MPISKLEAAFKGAQSKVLFTLIAAVLTVFLELGSFT